VAIVLKAGSLNLLEPSGPVQACNGIALTLPLITGLSLLKNDLVTHIKFTLGIFDASYLEASLLSTLLCDKLMPYISYH